MKILSRAIHTGCCSWSYLNIHEFRDEISGGYSSTLQAYARLFDTVEINSTFYRLPRLTTAEKWRNGADEINPVFQFTVKAFKGITHLHRFQKKNSLDAYEVIREVCLTLRAKYVLFQSPASFKPTGENIDHMGSFFAGAERSGLTFVWEPRGTWYDDTTLIEKVCRENDLVQCVDPLRNDPIVFGRNATAYFRLHGFGKPSMYRYNFSDEELTRLRDNIRTLPAELGQVFVLFNNENCYRNGRTFSSLIGGKPS